VSKENVAIVQRAVELFARGAVHDMRELLHPDIAVREQGPMGSGFNGPDEAVEFLHEWTSPWENFTFVAEEFFDGGEWVVVFVHQQGRGRFSGVTIDQHPAVVARVRDGRIIEFRTYGDRARALAVAGLA
jgi:ketosteroid isomerase-like protein